MKQYFLPILLLTSVFVSCASKKEETKSEEKQTTTSETTTPANTTAGKDTLIGPKGMVAAKMVNSGKERTFTYPNYTVKASELANAGGDKLTITNANKEVWEVPAIEMGFFYGISGDYLLLDEGSSDVMRKLHIFDLKTKKEVGSVQFDSDEMSLEGGKLTFYTLVEDKKVAKKPACPDAAEWKKSGLGVGYMQKRTVELSTGKVTHTEEFKCRALS